MSILSEALAQHAERLEQSAGELVTYRRGDFEIQDVSAVRGQGEFETVNAEGAHIMVRSTDFLIDRDHLIIDGECTEPQRGDLIELEDGQQFELMPGMNSTGWRWSDSHQTAFRIHCQRHRA